MPLFAACSTCCFDFAHRGEVFVELAAVGGAERGFELVRVAHHLIENALAHREAARVRGGRFGDVGAEEALEQIARIGDRRQRLRFGFPRHVVGVGAGIAVIAIARLARFFETDFERGQRGQMAVGVGGDLVGGSGELEIGAGGPVDFDAGHVGGERAAVIAGADLQRAAPVGGEIRHAP